MRENNRTYTNILDTYTFLFDQPFYETDSCQPPGTHIYYEHPRTLEL